MASHPAYPPRRAQLHGHLLEHRNAHTNSHGFAIGVLCYDGGLDERQATVITCHFGSLFGKRIVCGRENEREQFYQTHEAAPDIRPE